MDLKEKIVCKLTSAKEKVGAFVGKCKGKLIVAQASVCMTQLMMVNASAAPVDIFSRASELMKTLYSAIAGISSVTAGCVAAVCLYLMFFSKNQQTVESSIQWLKRIVICWLAIMLMSTIIYFITNNLGIGDTATL